MRTHLFLPFAVAAVSVCYSTVAAFAATPLEELKSFSSLEGVDLAKLATGEIEMRSITNLPIPRGVAVESVFVIKAPLEKTLSALATFDASKHGGTKVLVHREIAGSPGPAAFEALRSVNGGPMKNLTTLTSSLPKPTSMLNLSNQEAQNFTPPSDKSQLDAAVRDFWVKILSNRAQAFVSGGVNSQPAYEGSGKKVSPADDLNTLLKTEPKVQRQFSGLLSNSGLRGGGKPALYWEMVNIEGLGSLVLGAFYSTKVAENSYQALDIQYYGSAGYYALMTLQQLWAIELDGKPATLVWRGDLISSSALDGLRGIERKGSGRAMRIEIEKTIKVFQKAVN